MDSDKTNDFVQRSKRYKTKYFAALSELFDDYCDNTPEKAENSPKVERSQESDA